MQLMQMHAPPGGMHEAAEQLPLLLLLLLLLLCCCAAAVVLLLLYLCAGRVVLNEFATPPQGLIGYAQQVRAACVVTPSS
jgi:hypothetical protein